MISFTVDQQADDENVAYRLFRDVAADSAWLLVVPCHWYLLVGIGIIGIIGIPRVPRADS